ncbi:acetate/propionate family kinase [Sulfuricystis thermophila]|uniref:acetate/propionate family kinase n=1 Tax=Sulfuricystis thermophila TaxID=2496847 RepID=UPI001036A1A6|nr:acetate/propionate family kinase [Sulfuricystis thermophila]
MADALLTLNCGSATIKYALFRRGDPIPAKPEFAGLIEVGSEDGAHRAAIERLLHWVRAQAADWTIVGVGHRVVHGGERYAQPIVIDDAHLAQLKAFIPLAPLHQPHNLAGIEAMQAALPDVPQIACFDTAFHRTQPEIAQRFALPRHITAQGVRRYGFHGLSYEYIAETLPRHLDAGRANGRVIVAHLGNGASMCGMLGRQSQATTMGFTALEGLMMGTRTGSLDPGVLLYLMDYAGMDTQALTRLLYKESGLLGVSGISADMRVLLVSDRPEAQEAVELFCYRIVRETGSLAAALGGLDAFVFTGGIGEHAAPVRERVCRQLGWLGVEVDPAANANHQERISTPASKATVLVLPTNEEWMLARHADELIG